MLVKLGYNFERYLYNSQTDQDLELFVTKVEKHFSRVTVTCPIYRKMKFKGPLSIRLCLLN